MLLSPVLSTVQFVLLALACTVVYILGLMIYRLTLHPLARYPGPFLAKFTTLYDTYHCYKKDRHLDQFRCQQKYGNIFRYGPNFVVFQTLGGLREIYGNAKTNPIKKGPWYKLITDVGAANTAAVVDKERHVFQRRVLGHAFSDQALKSLEPFMVATIDRWAELLDTGASRETKGWSSPKNMAHYTNWVSFDVLGDLCFGKPFGLIESEELRFIPDMMLTRLRQGMIIGNSPIVTPFRYLQLHTSLHRYIRPSADQSFARFVEFIKQTLGARKGLETEIEKNGVAPRKDFIHYLREGRDPETGKGYTTNELLVELRLLMVAGSDTSSIVMAAAFFYLTRNPAALERLQKELRGAFANVDEIVTGPRLSGCHYLRAVIDECLRISPPVKSSLQRQVMEPGIVIDGMPLPVGTLVGTATYGMHYSSDHYIEPTVFKPERWLPGYTPREEIHRAKAAFCPFSLGNRGCIGKPLAYNELSIALGRVFWTYHVRLSYGDTTGEGPDGLYELKDIFVSERDGPLCEFKKHELASQ